MRGRLPDLLFVGRRRWLRDTRRGKADTVDREPDDLQEPEDLVGKDELDEDDEMELTGADLVEGDA
jgi:hypothetical protein